MKTLTSLVLLALTIFVVQAQSSIATGNLYLNYNYVDMEVVQMIQMKDEEGWNALEQKRKNGDPEALYKVGITQIYSELAKESGNANFTSGIQNINSAAERGHDQSMYLISLFYPLYNQPDDKQKVLNYLVSAAEKGNYAATYQLGVEYMLGETFEKNEAEATKWLQKSADLGNMYAMVYLGKIIEPKDFAKAINLYQKAAESQNNQAMYRLAQLSLEGKMGEPAYKKGKEWMNKAVNAGNQEALIWFENEAAGPNGDAEINHFLITTKWFKNFRIRDESKKMSFQTEFSRLQKMAENGNLEAMYYMAQLYKEGRAIKEDRNVALNWYTKAADRGHASSIYQIGSMYEYGSTPDLNTAITYYKKAHDAGNSVGTYKVGEFYKYGKGGYSINDKEALKWYTISAERGYSDAMLEVGVIYLCGRGVTKNQSISNSWLTKASEAGSQQAKKILSGEETNPCFDIRNVIR